MATNNTHPASDAALPAGEDTVAFVQEWLMSADYDPTKFDRDFAAAIDARVAAAAPKVASEAAGLREAERIARGWAEHFAGGDGDRRQLEKVCDDIADQIAALATNATDGAAGGGEVRLCPSDAERMREAWADLGDHLGHEAAALATTTTGADLLEQAARVASQEASMLGLAKGHEDAEGQEDRWYDGGIAAARRIAAAIRALSARNQTDDGGKA